VRGALRYIAARLQIANGTDLTPLQAEIGRRLTLRATIQLLSPTHQEPYADE
jgi:hypothetical protein